MFRLALVLGLIAGVARVDAAPTKSKVAHKQTAKRPAAKTKAVAKNVAKSPSAKSPSKPAKKPKAETKPDPKHQKSKHKKPKVHARVSRTPSRLTLSHNAGMPLGFTWPPTRAMAAAERDCESKLDRAGVEWERSPAEGRIVSPIQVASMEFGGIKYTNLWGSKGPHTLDCQFALALETIGPELRAIGVREVKFGSLYRWSNVRSHGQTRPFLSRHGLGLAMDIGSFVDDTGREAIVKRDYSQGDDLLLAIERMINASGNFRIVLTPQNDPISHSDHFHIEARSDFRSPDVP